MAEGFRGKMYTTVITVTDDSVLEYDVGFPILAKDLGVFVNGLKLEDTVDYIYDYSNNTVTLNAISVDDVINFRMFMDLR